MCAVPLSQPSSRDLYYPVWDVMCRQCTKKKVQYIVNTQYFPPLLFVHFLLAPFYFYHTLHAILLPLLPPTVCHPTPPCMNTPHTVCHLPLLFYHHPTPPSTPTVCHPTFYYCMPYHCYHTLYDIPTPPSTIIHTLYVILCPFYLITHCMPSYSPFYFYPLHPLPLLLAHCMPSTLLLPHMSTPPSYHTLYAILLPLLLVLYAILLPLLLLPHTVCHPTPPSYPLATVCHHTIIPFYPTHCMYHSPPLHTLCHPTPPSTATRRTMPSYCPRYCYHILYAILLPPTIITHCMRSYCPLYCYHTLYAILLPLLLLPDALCHHIAPSTATTHCMPSYFPFLLLPDALCHPIAPSTATTHCMPSYFPLLLLPDALCHHIAPSTATTHCMPSYFPLLLLPDALCHPIAPSTATTYCMPSYCPLLL